MKKGFANKIFVSITGWHEKHWRDKLDELKKYKIKETALFLERYSWPQREKIYNALEDSSIKKIPLIHIRNDMESGELEYLCTRYNNPYLTIHEDSFNHLDKWRGYHKNLFLELNYDNFVPSIVKVRKIGGFCIDLSHFKAAQEKWMKEFEYIIKKGKLKKLFVCNHLNGYSYKKNTDVHNVKKLSDFKYLKTLPKFLFGKIIAIETYNSIRDQIRFKKYLVKMFNKRFLNVK